ncbi:hypothetical protein Tco_0158448 [Tanacetum coccineum]
MHDTGWDRGRTQLPPILPLAVDKIVFIVVRSGTARVSSVAGTTEIVTVVSWYGPSKMHFLKASPFGLVSMYLKKRDCH